MSRAIFVPGYYAEAVADLQTGPRPRIHGAAVRRRWLGVARTRRRSAARRWKAPISRPTTRRKTRIRGREVQRAFPRRWGNVSDTLTGLGYDSVMMLVDAIKRAGTTDPPNSATALAATKNFKGVTGTITLDAQRNPDQVRRRPQVKDGKFVFVESINLIA